MSKEDYIKSLSRQYPEASDELLELAWQFHNMEKAGYYSQLLSRCNSNSDVAHKVIREMYTRGDIDAIKTRSEKFIHTLLPFTCMKKQGNAHSIAQYHVPNMLADTKVIKERNDWEKQKAQNYRQNRQPEKDARLFDKSVEIIIRTNSHQVMEELFLLAKKHDVTLVVDDSHLGYHPDKKQTYFIQIKEERDRLTFSVYEMPRPGRTVSGLIPPGPFIQLWQDTAWKGR